MWRSTDLYLNLKIRRLVRSSTDNNKLNAIKWNAISYGNCHFYLSA